MKILLTSILILIFLYSNAQKPLLDSLLSVSESQNGENKILTLSEISKNYYTINPDSGIYYGNIALELIKKEKN